MTVEYRTANVQRTRRSAAGVSPHTLAALFNHAWRRTSRTVGEHYPDERIEAAGRALTIDDYLLTRLMSVGAGRIVRRIARRAGITKGVGPHTLRHAFITAALDAGSRSATYKKPRRI